MESSESTPFEPQYDDTVEQSYVIDGDRFQRLLVVNEKILMPAMYWGRIVFDLYLHRRALTEENDHDLVLTIACNKQALDHLFRCSYNAIVQCDLQPGGISDTSEKSTVASKKNHTMQVPIMKLPPTEGLEAAHMKVTIKMTSWSGTFPKLLRGYTQKSDVTDCVLIVAGTRLYLSRWLLARYSPYFYNLLFNKNYMDASKEEYVVDDVTLSSFLMFLRIIDPDPAVTNNVQISSPEQLEDMLELAERFDCDTVKAVMEKFLMGETGWQIQALSLPRKMLLADRYRLAAPCSHAIKSLTKPDKLRDVHQSPEYSEFSDGLKAAILDATMTRVIAAPKSTSSDATNHLLQQQYQQAQQQQRPSHGCPTCTHGYNNSNWMAQYNALSRTSLSHHQAVQQLHQIWNAPPALPAQGQAPPPSITVGSGLQQRAQAAASAISTLRGIATSGAPPTFLTTQFVQMSAPPTSSAAAPAAPAPAVLPTSQPQSIQAAYRKLARSVTFATGGPTILNAPPPPSRPSRKEMQAELASLREAAAAMTAKVQPVQPPHLPLGFLLPPQDPLQLQPRLGRQFDWSEFTSELRDITASVPLFPLSVQLAADFDLALQYLETLTKEDVDSLSFTTRGMLVSTFFRLGGIVKDSKFAGEGRDGVRALLSAIANVKDERAAGASADDAAPASAGHPPVKKVKMEPMDDFESM